VGIIPKVRPGEALQAMHIVALSPVVGRQSTPSASRNRGPRAFQSALPYTKKIEIRKVCDELF
jgi:hypothetical protein